MMVAVAESAESAGSTTGDEVGCSRVSITDLDDRGFVVIRGFLDDDTLAALHADWAAAPPDGNCNYPLRSPSPAAHKLVARRIDAVVSLVRERTSLAPDLPVGASLSLGL
jgi:hypothetical protein